MSLSYGFYDSYNGDRVYNAEQFSSFLDGIVYDGVYQAVGNKFYVRAAPGLMVTVDTGRAWFDHTWTLNNTLMTLALPVADTVYPRIDAVVIEVNHTNRENYIKILEGTPRANPARPALTKTDDVKQWALAYVTVYANATSISDSNIVNVVDTAETPLASALALAGIPSGGNVGQVLAKKSGESGAVDWYDFDKLPYDKWYLADGLNEGNILAAYAFKNAVNETSALVNINEYNSYPLVKSDSGVTWSKSEGFYLPSNQFLNNEALYKLNPVTAILKFASIGGTDRTIALHSRIIDNDSNKGVALMINHAFATQSYIGHVIPKFGVVIRTGYGRPVSGYNSSIDTQAGILGATFNGTEVPSLYFNGTSLGITPTSYSEAITSYPTLGGMKLIGGDPTTYGVADSTTFRIQAALFLNVAITAEQHRQLANHMNSAFA